MEKKEKTLLDLIKNLVIAILVVVVLIYGFFNIYLPFSTNHGETLTVPNLEGMHIGEVKEFLEKRNLRYEVEKDSGYSSKYLPSAVLKQFPLVNSKVKENRKIYLTLNKNTPPYVRLPKFNGLSIKHAQLELKSRGLFLGEIQYKPGLYINSIDQYLYKGRQLQENDSVPKGAKIDIIANDGLGNQEFEAPNLTFLDLEEARFTIIGSGLKLGDVYYQKKGLAKVEKEGDDGEKTFEEVSVASGKIFKQNPRPGRRTRIGESMNIWVVELDSAELVNQPNLEIIEE